MSPTVVLTWASATRSVGCSSVTYPVLPDAARLSLLGPGGAAPGTQPADDRGDDGHEIDLAGEGFGDGERAPQVAGRRQVPVPDRRDRHEAEVEEVLGALGGVLHEEGMRVEAADDPVGKPEQGAEQQVDAQHAEHRVQ